VRKNRIHHIIRLLFVFFCMNVVWYIAYLLMNHSILPSPFAVYNAMFHLGGQTAHWSSDGTFADLE